MLVYQSLLRRSSGRVFVGYKRAVNAHSKRALTTSSILARDDALCQNSYGKVATAVLAVGGAAAIWYNLEAAKCDTGAFMDPPTFGGHEDTPEAKKKGESHFSWTPVQVANENFEEVIQAHRKDSLRIFTSDQVSENDGEDGKPVWMSYGGYVYDVTDFINNHPGGSEKIMMAAGTVSQYF
jgi:hypothetical protein